MNAMQKRQLARLRADVNNINRYTGSTPIWDVEPRLDDIIRRCSQINCPAARHELQGLQLAMHFVHVAALSLTGNDLAMWDHRYDQPSADTLWAEYD